MEQGAPDFGTPRADLELWRRGDPEGFERIWTRYRRALELMVVRRIKRLGNPNIEHRLDPADILQEAAAVVLRKMPGFVYSGPGSLKAWMEEHRREPGTRPR